MPSLFERVISADENTPKIPIHGIRAFAGEIHRGNRAPADVIATYNLDPQQQGDLALFLTKMASAPDKVALSNMVFDWLALAEMNVMPGNYRSESAFWAAIDAEIAAQTP